jgi:thiol-disulfide isomerase/thioredoxin
MVYLSAAVAVTGAVLLANLALTLALVRRIRGLSERPAHQSHPVRAGLPAGATVPDFTAATITGETRSRGGMAGSRGLIGFFAAGCDPCHRQLPQFAELAATIPGGASQVLAVVTGDGEPAAELVRGLDEVAAIVREPEEGDLCKVFAVRGFPTYYLIGGDGQVEGAGNSVPLLVRTLQPR